MDVYQKTPNRMQDVRVRDASSEIMNFVDKIPEYNAKLVSADKDGGIFTLSTQSYGPQVDPHFMSDAQSECDTIAKNIEDHLKKEGFKKVSIKPADESDDIMDSNLKSSGYFDATPLGWGSGLSGIGNAGRQILYAVRGTYAYTAAS